MPAAAGTAKFASTVPNGPPRCSPPSSTPPASTAPTSGSRPRPRARTAHPGRSYVWRERVPAHAARGLPYSSMVTKGHHGNRKKAVAVDRDVDRCPRIPSAIRCIHGQQRKASLLARRVQRTIVLPLIRWFRVRPPGAPLRGLHVSAGSLFTFGPCRAAVTAAGQDQGRCIPAFPRKRPAQLRTGSPTCGLAALNLWSELNQGRIRAGQS
jgi:hypothetical protein